MNPELTSYITSLLDNRIIRKPYSDVHQLFFTQKTSLKRNTQTITHNAAFQSCT